MLGWLLIVSACSEGGDEPVRVIRLEQMRPRPEAREGVFLNEALVFHFSGDVDGSSVTSTSLSVRPEGESTPAKGDFEIDGGRVRFVPDLGKERDLSDGGLRPGTRYEVLVQGFPAVDGVRSEAGWPLAQSARFFFRTAALAEPREQIFDDSTPGVGAALRLNEAQSGPIILDSDDSLELMCSEPLDPSTLVDGEFVLQPVAAGAEPVPLDPRLRANSREEGAILELRPRRLLGVGRYYLRPRAPERAGLQPSITLRDFGGNQVWYPLRPVERVPIDVLERGEKVQPEFPLSFLNDQLYSQLVVPGVDGSAYWNDIGQVTVRYPRSAGLGTDGSCELGVAESRSDIHSTSMIVPEGRTAQLLSEPGLVVLRSQGKLVVSGRLTRKAGSGQPMVRHIERGQALSEWLKVASEEDFNWTVIVAGGDLVIEGELEVEGPLLLAAGGRIRITGRVRAQKGDLWLVGEGGGGDIDPTASRADLELDAPFTNPLVNSLTFALLSNPVPPSGGVSRWLDPIEQAEARNGSYSIQYLPPDLPYGAPLEDWGAVDSPRDLLDSSSLRLLIQLRVDPAGPGQKKYGLWYPPVVDDVRLIWEP